MTEIEEVSLIGAANLSEHSLGFLATSPVQVALLSALATSVNAVFEGREVQNKPAKGLGVRA